MGCDGGTIPKRDELVRTKKKPEQIDKNAEILAKWKHCFLSSEELRSPIVACEMGRLYNKEAVLHYLLDKSSSDTVAHIRSLKDIKELNLTENPAFQKQAAEKGDAYTDKMTSRFICPVVGLEMNGKYRFCYLYKCGCVLSERALKEVKSEVCHKCGSPFDEDDIVIINGNNDDVKALQLRLEQRRLKAKLEKKAKKRKIADISTEESSEKQVMTNGMQEVAEKKGTVENKSDKVKSIAKNPKVSSVYKSIFTSCDAAKKQEKAHWITCNPLYN